MRPRRACRSTRGTARRQSAPSPSASTLCTVAAGIGGAASCSLVRAARYGAAMSSGSAASKTDSAWPNFMAPPLSSPSTLNSCSAVRCCTSCATISAGRPPIRLPTPSAVRPATPIGRLASFTLREIAHFGMSLTPLFSLITYAGGVGVHAKGDQNGRLRAHLPGRGSARSTRSTAPRRPPGCRSASCWGRPAG